MTTVHDGDGVLGQAGELNEQLLLLTRAMHVLRTHLATAAPGGVPWATYTLLFHLVTGGPRRASALAECVYVDPSTVSRQVDQLVRLGLVERRADPADGRATLLAATEAGRGVYRRIRSARDRMVAGLLTDWPAEDVAALNELLGRLNTRLADAMPRLLTAVSQGSLDDVVHLSAPPSAPVETGDHE
jgi:DNA-binding MarR family transcriptional regulator